MPSPSCFTKSATFSSSSDLGMMVNPLPMKMNTCAEDENFSWRTWS